MYVLSIIAPKEWGIHEEVGRYPTYQEAVTAADIEWRDVNVRIDWVAPTPCSVGFKQWRPKYCNVHSTRWLYGYEGGGCKCRLLNASPNQRAF